MKAVDDGRLLFELAGVDPRLHFSRRFGKSSRVVDHDEPLHACPSKYQVEVVLGSGKRSGRVVARNATADHDACVHGNARQTDIQYLAADVVEVDVDPVRTQPVEFCSDILGFVVDGAVEPKRVGEPGAFFSGPSHAEHGAAFNFGDLTGHAARRTRCAADDDDVSGFRFTDVEQPEVGCHAGAAKYAERNGGVHVVCKYSKGQGLTVGNHIVLHAKASRHLGALRVVSVIARNDRADAAGAHDVAKL